MEVLAVEIGFIEQEMWFMLNEAAYYNLFYYRPE